MLTRYTIGYAEGPVKFTESPTGEWVKWEDMKKMLDGYVDERNELLYDVVSRLRGFTNYMPHWWRLRDTPDDEPI